MSQIIPKNRLRAFSKQKGRCYYCDSPMWLEGRSKFAAMHGITRKLAKSLRCTAEHLLARQDGGTDEMQNIVAACSFCNSMRHRVPNALSPVEYRKEIKLLLRCQVWHPREFQHLL